MLFFTIVQLLFFSGLVLIWMRIKREHSDDSRWSRNLQILQSKIAVFEDLSDRTEVQVNQLTIMLENKMCDLQRKIDEADEILSKISSSMKKSIEVAQIFQDKIPHEEIIERQNTVKFVRAALMANEGKSVDEISEVVNLPKSQIEFIVKVNAQRLSFDPNQMPDWLKSEVNRGIVDTTNMMGTVPNTSFTRSPLRPLNQLINQKLTFIENESASSSTKINPQENELNVISIEDMAALSQKSSSDLALAHLRAATGMNLGVDDPIVLSGENKSAKELSLPMSSNPKTEIQSAMDTRRVKEIGVRPFIFPRIEMPPKNELRSDFKKF